MRRITPVQGLTLFFLLGLVLLTVIFSGKIPLWRSLLLRYSILLGLLFLLKISSDKRVMGKAGSFLHHFSPVFFIIIIYQFLGDTIQYLHEDIDPQLVQMDRFLFGVDPTLWMERWIVPWLSDLMSIAYVSYYFLPVILVAVLYLKGHISDFEEAVFVLAFGYYVSFIGYILFPAVGPRYTMAPLYSVPLDGSLITHFVRDLLNAIEHNKRDCMPSGHTQVALMVLFLSRRHEKKLFYLFFPFVCGLILSTVYLRYHYVVDLVAGALLAFVCVPLGIRLYKIWQKKVEDRRWKIED